MAILKDEELVVGGLYKHQKGGVYRLIGIGCHTETEEKLVAYKNELDGQLWFRPKEMFCDGRFVRHYPKTEASFMLVTITRDDFLLRGTYNEIIKFCMKESGKTRMHFASARQWLVENGFSIATEEHVLSKDYFE